MSLGHMHSVLKVSLYLKKADDENFMCAKMNSIIVAYSKEI